MTDFTDEMDKLAAEIAKEAGGDAKAFGDRIDAFKALMPYYALQTKQKIGVEVEDGLPNFDHFTSQILTAENVDGSNEPGLRGSRRNGN